MYYLLTSAFISVDIKVDLRSNSRLLAVNLPPRAAERNVLDDYAYPVFRLTRQRNAF